MGKKASSYKVWKRRKCDTAMARHRGFTCTKMSSKCDTCFCCMYFRAHGMEWVHHPCGSDDYWLR